MRLVCLFYILLITSSPGIWADDTPWETNYSKAVQRALLENKLILLNFTGSDWCIWCQKLDIEIFHSTEFLEGIDKLAVPVIVDFPLRRLQPAQLKSNRILKERWEVDAFPSVILLDPRTNKSLWRHGYLNTNVKDYLLAIKEASGARPNPPAFP